MERYLAHSEQTFKAWVNNQSHSWGRDFSLLYFWGNNILELSGHDKEGISRPREGKLDPGGVLKPY